MGSQAIAGIAIQGSMFLMIMSVAMQTEARAVGQNLHDPGLLLRGLVAVNVVPPLVATMLVLTLHLDPPIAQGLLLMAISPLAPLIPGNAYRAGAERARIVALYAALIVLAIIVVPLTVMLLNAVFRTHAVARLGTIGDVVLVSAIIPILMGLTIGEIFPRFSRRAAPAVAFVSYAVLAVFVFALLWMAGRQFLAMLGNGTIFAFGLTVLAGLIAGHLLGGPERGGRIALAFAASVRHPGIAAAIAHASGASPKAILATILFLLNGVVVTMLYQQWLKWDGRRRLNGAEVSSSTAAS